jgi:hypothetical protein
MIQKVCKLVIVRVTGLTISGKRGLTTGSAAAEMGAVMRICGSVTTRRGGS